MLLRDLLQRIHDFAIVLFLVALLVFIPCCISVTVDVRLERLNQTKTMADIQAGLFSKIDEALSKADTFLLDWSKFEKVTGKQLNLVRIQVKQSSDDATHQTKLSAKAATTAMTAVAASTEKVLAAVTDQPPPVITVEPSKAVPVAPPTVIVAPSIAPAVIPKILPSQKKGRNWLQKVWGHLH